VSGGKDTSGDAVVRRPYDRRVARRVALVVVTALMGCYQDLTYSTADAPMQEGSNSAFVQGSATFTFAETTLSATFPDPATEGDDIILFVGTFDAKASLPTDDGGNAYATVIVPTPTMTITDATSLAIYAATDIQRTTTVSVSITNMGAQHSFTIAALDYAAGALGNNSGSNGAGASAACTAPGTSSAQIVVAGLAVDGFSNVLEPGAMFMTRAFPNDDQDTAPELLAEDGSAQSGSTTATFGTDDTNTWVCELVLLDRK
jgi:hypothetical protein